MLLQNVFFDSERTLDLFDFVGKLLTVYNMYLRFHTHPFLAPG